MSFVLQLLLAALFPFLVYAVMVFLFGLLAGLFMLGWVVLAKLGEWLAGEGIAPQG